MGDETLGIGDPLHAFNADRTPGPRKRTLDRVMREGGLTYRAAFKLLVEYDWNEDVAVSVATERLVG